MQEKPEQPKKRKRMLGSKLFKRLCKTKQALKQSYSEKQQSLIFKTYWRPILKEIFERLNCSQIKSLRFYYDCIERKHLRVIVEQNWDKLQQLIFYQTGMQNNYSLKMIIQLNEWPSLKRISLIGCFDPLDDGIWQKFYTTFQHLTEIDLSLNVLSSQSLQPLNDPNLNFGNLQILILNQNSIGSSGGRILSKADLPQLQQLFLEHCQIGDEGIRCLVKSNWPNLTRLILNWNQIKIDGLICIINSFWPKLRKLSLAEANIDVMGILHQVKYQNLGDNIHMTEDYIRSLITMPNNIHIKVTLLRSILCKFAGKVQGQNKYDDKQFRKRIQDQFHRDIYRK